MYVQNPRLNAYVEVFSLDTSCLYFGRSLNLLTKSYFVHVSTFEKKSRLNANLRYPAGTQVYIST